MAALAIPTVLLWSVGMSFLTFGVFFFLWIASWAYWIAKSRRRWGPIIAAVTLAFVVVTPHFGFWASSGCLEERAQQALIEHAADPDLNDLELPGGVCGLVDYSELTVRDISSARDDADLDSVAAVFHDAGPPLFNYGWVERGYVYSPGFAPSDCRPIGIRQGTGGGFGLCDVDHLSGDWYAFRIKVTTS